jgi:GNAT superfamily N-acetyltransferase
MIIRTITPTDCSYLVELLAIYRQEQGREFSQDQAEASYQQFMTLAQVHDGVGHDASSRVWVVCHDERPTIPLGYLNSHFGYFPMLGAPELYISDLLIHPSFRGQGFGSQLLAQAESYARSLGCKRIMLNNLKTDQSYGRGYYLSHGFEERTNAANMVKGLVGSNPGSIVSQVTQAPLVQSHELPLADSPESLLYPQTYPQELLSLLAIEEGMVLGVVNDFAGTLSELLLQAGCRVYSLFSHQSDFLEVEHQLMGYTGSTVGLFHDPGIQEAWKGWDLMVLCQVAGVESSVSKQMEEFPGVVRILRAEMILEQGLEQSPEHDLEQRLELDTRTPENLAKTSMKTIQWHDGTHSWNLTLVDQS